MKCWRGVSFWMSRAILTPDAAGERVAVPSAWPSALVMFTTTGFGEDCWAIAAPENANKVAAQARIFISILFGLKIERIRRKPENNPPYSNPNSPGRE